MRLLTLIKQLQAEVPGLPQALADALCGLLLFGLGLLHRQLGLAQHLLRLLPVAVQRLQTARRLAGRQSPQLRLSRLQLVLGTLFGQCGCLLLALRLEQIITPLPLALQIDLFSSQPGFLGAQLFGFGVQHAALLGA